MQSPPEMSLAQHRDGNTVSRQGSLCNGLSPQLISITPDYSKTPWRAETSGMGGLGHEVLVVGKQLCGVI